MKYNANNIPATATDKQREELMKILEYGRKNNEYAMNEIKKQNAN